MIRVTMGGATLSVRSGARGDDGSTTLARSVIGSWWLLALLSLGVATLFAVVLVVARTPFLGLGASFFRTALVLHVDLAVVVWFLAAAAGLWLAAVPVTCCVLSRMARGGVWLAGVGVIVMLLSALDEGASPILANYVPVLDSTLFFAGLGAFLTGVGLAALAALASLPATWSALLREESGSGWRWPVIAAALVYWVAVLVFVMAMDGAGDVSADERLWGGGHVLQIVHTLMLTAAWLYLGREALGQLKLSRRWILVLVIPELLAAFADLSLAMIHPLGSLAYRAGFTDVMRWLTWPAPVLLAVAMLMGYRRLGKTRRLDFNDIALIASVALFGLGCAVGATIRGETTAVPAHYHGTVGAVTLAYMLWARNGLVRHCGVSMRQWLWRWQPMVYGLGIGCMVLGLAWAGWLGVPRKSPHHEIVLAHGMEYFAMGLAGTGGLLATLGAGVFVLWVLIEFGKRKKTKWM